MTDNKCSDNETAEAGMKEPQSGKNQKVAQKVWGASIYKDPKPQGSQKTSLETHLERVRRLTVNLDECDPSLPLHVTRVPKRLSDLKRQITRSTYICQLLGQIQVDVLRGHCGRIPLHVSLPSSDTLPIQDKYETHPDRCFHTKLRSIWHQK